MSGEISPRLIERAEHIGIAIRELSNSVFVFREEEDKKKSGGRTSRCTRCSVKINALASSSSARGRTWCIRLLFEFRKRGLLTRYFAFDFFFNFALVISRANYLFLIGFKREFAVYSILKARASLKLANSNQANQQLVLTEKKESLESRARLIKKILKNQAQNRSTLRMYMRPKKSPSARARSC